MIHSPQSKIIIIIFLFFLALGIFFRIYDLGQRNLWTDEAWVALAATQPTPGAALQAGKSTPPLYLLTVWGMVQVFGRSESILRLTSCLLGLGALLLLWPLSRVLLPPWPALTAFALSSISYRLVYFSKELKQYSADIFFAVLIFLLVEWQLRRQGKVGWLWFTTLAAIGLGFSHSLVFILPVAAPVLWWKLPQHRRSVIFSFLALGLVFLGYYRFFFQSQVDPELLVYWQCDFPDVTCGRDFACWLAAGLSRFGRYFFYDWGAPLGLVFVTSGWLFFYKENKARSIWYFCGPILAALAAAFAERYPFMGHAGGVRLMMFNAPMLYIMTGAGISAIFSWLWRRDSTNKINVNNKATLNNQPKITQTTAGDLFRNWNRLAAIILAVMILVWLQPVKLWRENLQPQDNLEEVQPLVHYLQTHRQTGDGIFVYYFAIDPFKYYYQGPWENIMWGQSCHDTALPWPLKRLQQIERLWVLFSHFESKAFVDSFVATLLGPGWTKQMVLSQPGAMLYCFLPPWSRNNSSAIAISPAF